MDRLRSSLAGRAELTAIERTRAADTTRTALERMQMEVQFEEPDILVAQFGTNDSTYLLSNRGVPLVSRAAFRANICEMIVRAWTFGTRRMLFVTNHQVALDRFDINGKTPSENTDDYHDIVRSICADEGVHLADMARASRKFAPAQLCQSDRIHVNETGSQLYADVVGEMLGRIVDGLMLLRDRRPPPHDVERA